MNRREIFNRIMNFEEVGRVLVDCGKQVGSIHKWAYPAIREEMGLVPAVDIKILDRGSQCVVIDEDLLEAWHIDFRWIVPEWINVTYLNETTYTNMTGTVFESSYGDYFSIKESPMRDYESISEVIDSWPWPNIEDIKVFEGMRDKAKQLYENTDYIIGIDGIKGGILQNCLELRGYDQFFIDLIIDPEEAHQLLEKMTQLYIDLYTLYLKEVGDYGHLIYLTDDFGSQNSLLMSVDHWREFVKPYTKRLIDHIKTLAPHLKIMFHTDGSILPLIEDIIEIGVDILDPVQTSVEELKDTHSLNEKYGKRIAFHGAIDVQSVLINLDANQVEEEVKMRIKDLGTGGGYIIGTCHNINRDIPAENLKRMYETIHRYGRYPLNF